MQVSIMVPWTRKHSTITLLLSGLLVGLIGMADYATGQAFSLAVFYLLPVVLITWTLGRAGGLRGDAVHPIGDSAGNQGRGEQP